jgi:hypothetical protein
MENDCEIRTGSPTQVEYSDDFSGVKLRKYLKHVIFKSRPGVRTLKLIDYPIKENF